MNAAERFPDKGTISRLVARCGSTFEVAWHLGVEEEVLLAIGCEHRVGNGKHHGRQVQEEVMRNFVWRLGDARFPASFISPLCPQKVCSHCLDSHYEEMFGSSLESADPHDNVCAKLLEPLQDPEFFARETLAPVLELVEKERFLLALMTWTTLRNPRVRTPGRRALLCPELFELWREFLDARLQGSWSWRGERYGWNPARLSIAEAKSISRECFQVPKAPTGELARFLEGPSLAELFEDVASHLAKPLTCLSCGHATTHVPMEARWKRLDVANGDWECRCCCEHEWSAPDTAVFVDLMSRLLPSLRVRVQGKTALGSCVVCGAESRGSLLHFFSPKFHPCECSLQCARNSGDTMKLVLEMSSYKSALVERVQPLEELLFLDTGISSEWWLDGYDPRSDDCKLCTHPLPVRCRLCGRNENLMFSDVAAAGARSEGVCGCRNVGVAHVRRFLEKDLRVPCSDLFLRANSRASKLLYVALPSGGTAAVLVDDLVHDALQSEETALETELVRDLGIPLVRLLFDSIACKEHPHCNTVRIFQREELEPWRLFLAEAIGYLDSSGPCVLHERDDAYEDVSCGTYAARRAEAWSPFNEPFYVGRTLAVREPRETLLATTAFCGTRSQE